MAHEVNQGEAPAATPEPPSQPLHAWVLVNGPNVLCTGGVAATFVADFDRNGGVSHSPAESALRITRPGTIVLANLDLDNPPASLPADLIPILNANDNVVNGAQDERDLTLLKLRPPQPCAVSATQIKLVCHADDAKRIRVFQVGLASGAPQLGEGSAGGRELVLPTTPNFAIDFRIEALTLPGDPTLPAPTGAPPAPPEGLSVTLPPGAAAGSPIYPARGPAEVWLELQHSVSPPLRAIRDVGLVTIAPWIMLPNTQPVTRLFFTYYPPTSSSSGNHEFAYDICEAAAAALGGGAPLNPDETVPFTASAVGSTAPVYLIDGNTLNDQWVQDELEIGYCWAPHAWMHVVLHNPRGNPLKEFVKGQLAAPGVGVFYRLPESGNSINFGGNLEVSPPVRGPTPRLARSAGGPTVPAHPPAPFGKMIIGDCTPRPAKPELREFLTSQKVQPVLPLDTSWLLVGHVDEFMSFVPSRSGKRFKLVMASVRAMDALLRNIVSVPLSAGRTNFHVGLWDANGEYAEKSAEELLDPAPRGYADYNSLLRRSKLGPLQTRLEQGLGLAAADIIPLPTYFELPNNQSAAFGSASNQTIAYTVGSVNMQVVNGNLLVPRPFGPRMRPDDARRVVEQTMASIGWRKPVSLGPTGGFHFWARPGNTLHNLAKSFAEVTSAADRANIIDHMRGSASLTATNVTAANAALHAIANAPQNAGLTNARNGYVDASGTFVKCKRVFIPQATVDVLEVYMRSVFEAEGNTVHFIDDWYTYHICEGEVHCGTNVIRTPPEVNPRFSTRWWDRFDPAYDFSYVPSA